MSAPSHLLGKQPQWDCFELVAEECDVVRPEEVKACAMQNSIVDTHNIIAFACTGTGVTFSIDLLRKATFKLMCTLSSFPAEALILIFEHCDDFAQVIALASACKYTYAVYLSSDVQIMWGVGRKQIRWFNDALMAVRATAIVLEAYKTNESPPAVNVGSLSGFAKLPRLDEIREVLNMQYLVQCLDFRYINARSRIRSGPPHFETVPFPTDSRRQHGSSAYRDEQIARSEGVTLESFKDNFYRGMYRVFLAGALFARAYMNPMFRAVEQGIGNGFFQRCGDNDYWTDDLEEIEDNWSEVCDVDFIHMSAVYNFDVSDITETGQWRDREYENIFGSFAQWIIEDGEQRAMQELTDVSVPVSEHENDQKIAGAVRELMLLLAAFEHSASMFDSRSGVGIKGKDRTVTIVRLGVFSVDTIILPTASAELRDACLSTHKGYLLKGTKGLNVCNAFDIDLIAHVLSNRRRTSEYVYHSDYPGPSPILDFWHFTLKHYLSLGFKSGTFFRHSTDSIWRSELGRADVFCNPNWSPVQRFDPSISAWNHGRST